MDNVGVAAFGIIVAYLKPVAVTAPVNHVVEKHARFALVFQQRFRKLRNGVDTANALRHPRVFSARAHDCEKVQGVREII